MTKLEIYEDKNSEGALMLTAYLPERETQTYYFYTKREAYQLFRKHCKEIESNQLVDKPATE